MPQISHQTDEQLELYALGRLPEPQAAIVEEHLLACASCQERLDDVETFALAMRQALATKPAPAARTDWLAWFMPAMWRPGLRLPGAPPWPLIGVSGFAALALAIVLFLHSGRGVAPIASLQLTATRGEVQSSVGLARETDITLTDAPPQAALRVDVVDSAGAPVWSGALGADGKVNVAGQLPQGGYFVRLYDGAGRLLHEYGFSVQ